jgi:hypothetical protein
MEAAKRSRASVETCLGALCIVAREGWLCKAGWCISKAAHVFAKPHKALLTSKSSQTTVNAMLVRPLLTALRLRGAFGSTPPLPVGLRKLDLSRFCGTLGELPQSLTSLSASGWRDAAGIAAVARALEAAPTGLHQLHLSFQDPEPEVAPTEDELEGVQCPAGVTTLRLRGVGWRMQMPSQLGSAAAITVRAQGGGIVQPRY